MIKSAFSFVSMERVSTLDPKIGPSSLGGHYCCGLAKEHQDKLAAFKPELALSFFIIKVKRL